MSRAAPTTLWIGLAHFRPLPQHPLHGTWEQVWTQVLAMANSERSFLDAIEELMAGLHLELIELGDAESFENYRQHRIPNPALLQLAQHAIRHRQSMLVRAVPIHESPSQSMAELLALLREAKLASPLLTRFVAPPPTPAWEPLTPQQVWLGLVRVKLPEDDPEFDGIDGDAYLHVLLPAESREQFLARAETLLADLGCEALAYEWLRTLAEQLKIEALAPELEELAQEVMTHHEARWLGVHTFPIDDE